MLSPVLTIMLAGFVTLLLPDGEQGQAGVSVGEASRDAPAARLAEEVRRCGWLVFSARSERGDWDLFVCRPDGSDRHNITRTPESNEAGAQFSRDGRRLLFRRLPVDEPVDGNHHGIQGELVLAASDGSTPTVLGRAREYPWASWSPDGKQVACLSVKGITIVDVASRQVVRKLPRLGFFQQMTWSPDGRWLSGVSNSFGASWSVALIEIATEKSTPSVTPIVARPTGFRTAAVSSFQTARRDNRRIMVTAGPSSGWPTPMAGTPGFYGEEAGTSTVGTFRPMASTWSSPRTCKKLEIPAMPAPRWACCAWRMHRSSAAKAMSSASCIRRRNADRS